MKKCIIMNTADKVLQAAKRLFAQKGYEGVSVRDVCDEAQVSPNAVHYHFKSKENLYQAIFDQLSSSKLELTERILQPPIQDKSDFRTRLEIFMEETLISFLDERDTMYIVYIEILQLFPHTKGQFPQEMLKGVEILNSFITRAQEAGIVRKDIDVDIISGLIHDRICNQVMFCKSYNFLFDKTTDDPVYRRHWIQQNINLILSGIYQPGKN